MKAGEWLALAQTALARHGSPDPEADAQWLLSDALKAERSRLRFCLNEELSDEAVQWLRDALARREAGEPLQYIEGTAWFMGLEFEVDPRVLIPRQDTETLCEFAMDFLAARPGAAVLDLCTGSGALAVALAKRFPGAAVCATDLSEDALCVARRNAQRHGVDIDFLAGDLFAPLVGRSFDLIVSNPPYLTDEDMRSLQREVAREPAMALRGGADGLMFYRRIASALPAHLRRGGCAVVEVGAGQAARVAGMLNDALPGAAWGIQKDLSGIERIVWVQR